MFSNPFTMGMPLPQCLFLAVVVLFAMIGSTSRAGLSAFIPFAFMWRPSVLPNFDCSIQRSA
jgi:hypothetical protein